MDQVLPLSNLYYKVQLKEGVTDEFFLSTVARFNNNQKDRQLHSFFDGTTTQLFHPPPAPRTRVISFSPAYAPLEVPRAKDPVLGALVLENPHLL